MYYKLLLLIGVFFHSSKISFSQTMTDYTAQVFPTNHALNTRIDHLPVHPNSDNIIDSMGADRNLHPDFGTSWNDGGTTWQIGIPYNIVDDSQPLVPIIFSPWGDESDPGPWPIPANPYIETVFDWRETSDGDRHMLIVNKDSEMLYETGNTFGNDDGTQWQGGAGAIFDLKTNDLRPEGWTSSDAAGLPIFPLLIRYDEVERAVESGGEIPHAIRFTASRTQKAYIWPARHYASSLTDEDYPAMGLRFRLKSDFDISGFTPRVQAILRTFKKYGLIMSDNGSNWFIQGTHDDRWDDNELRQLKSVTGNNFEAVDISEWLNHPDFNINSATVPVDIVDVQDNKYSPEMQVKAYPNPFSTIAYVNYFLPESGLVNIKLVNLIGKEISLNTNEIQGVGSHQIVINANKLRLVPGVYFVRLQYCEHIEVLKLNFKG